MSSMTRSIIGLLVALSIAPAPLRAQEKRAAVLEITPESETALARGLQWLATNQGAEGNWRSNDLGLVSMGALAFLAAGHMPGRGRYGDVVDRALDYVVRHAKPSGLLNISHERSDMYNHGLAAFVLGQAYGMTNDDRLRTVLDRALELIAATQCDDGGWDYVARRKAAGHDLSLAVMQAKALRSAVDSGLEVSPDVIRLAIGSVHDHYRAKADAGKGAAADRRGPGQFTYDGSKTSLAMAAAGVVCLQEFGRYDDWRIPKNMDVISRTLRDLGEPKKRDGRLPCGEAYALYYVGQAIYQVGGTHWREGYPILRDWLVASQKRTPGDPEHDGAWADYHRLHGTRGRLWGTAVGCLILAIPNRYLPILQEGKIDSVASQFGER